MIRIIALYNFPKILNLLFIVGILRGGGDTFFAMMAESICVWGIGVPLAFAGALYFGLPSYIVMALFMFEEVVKAIWCMHRFLSKKWIKNVVDQIA